MTLVHGIYAAAGIGILMAAVLPPLVRRRPFSIPMVFLLAGAAIALLPLGVPVVDPVRDRVWVEHVTEVCVIVSLMGAGLAIDRPFGWRTWAGAWRFLGLALPLTVGGVALLGGWLMGWPPAVALLLAGALAPTDPVLAAEVRVGEPTSGDDEEDEEEVRFTLTSEAGLNDGLAMPFVLAAVALAAAGGGWSAGWVGHWLLADVLMRAVVGLVAGVAVGRLLGRLFFRSRHARLSQQMEGFTALGATFTAYGLTELLHGYGFLAVFVAACTIRGAERSHGYHQVLHGFSEQIERLLTAVLLFLLGGYLVADGLADLPWQGALLGLALILVIRPAAGAAAQLGFPAEPRERAVTALFGIRGIGSLFYLAYALGEGPFTRYADELWAVTAFTVLVSVLLHGATATPVIRHLDRRRERVS
ncbi:cation:proton antiporter domain-containing protein [Streptomyces drozdowiczii]|uniref:Cation:proton antiporter n=1 Tax=Streptomyces drozdowiczii TaxID=202862 RepID=A0ABY6PM47_9ACTN|nr:cation:proton antiporter [Streptomyces drozdowiczii]MCX0247761.1 cation:proton antiporter [Streptomyces drozdowiczii]UZK52876.1 cation:proton antiporter [Streptomyces drozdowiczii]